ncbi:MAG: KH domain-containing protein [Clostridiales bacterium]|jgi:spoIIIJ-associated protein|nr:KH domain-containing protein [Clostridiales bacterium]
MKSFQATGRTVEDAISAGLAENGLSISDVTVEILEEGSKGLFGLFGSRDAKVLLTVKENDTASNTFDLFKDSLSKPAARASQPLPQTEKPARQAQQERREKQPRRQDEKKAEKPREDQPQEEKQPAARAPRQRKPKEKKPQAQPVEQVREQEIAVRQVRNLTALENPEEGSPAFNAGQFLKELTRLMGLDITVSLALDEEGHVFATMEGDPQGILIGRRGETLDALQYLTSLKVNKGQENYIRVTIDSEGYRQKREDALIRLANRMANRARKTGRRVSMEPMNPYERRIFHSALQSAPGIATHSEGEEPNRHIVITPVKTEDNA